MKNNQYLQKYGEKALELLRRKELKQTNAVEGKQMEDEQQSKIQLKKVGSRGSERVQKTSSQKSLNKGSKSKSKINLSQNQNQYTFQKPLNLQNLQAKEKNRKKLIISGLSTPKNRSTRVAQGAQQKIQSSSTKKKATELRIGQKLNEALYKSKSTKSIVKQLLQCLDMISQHETKINKWINQFKDIVYHLAEELTTYKRKYKEELAKSKRVQKQIQQIHESHKSNQQKKRKPIQIVIMEENQKLRDKVQLLEHKIQNFQRKQMVLIGTLEKFKCEKPRVHETNSSSKKEQNYIASRVKADFYENLQEDEDEQSSNQQFQENR